MTKSKLLYKTEHLDLLETEKGFVYAQRRTINSIAVLCVKKINEQFLFLIRFQPMPEISTKRSWFDLYPCPVTGSIEENQTQIETVIKELYEETGLIIESKNIVDSSFCISSTQMNETVYNFLVNANGCFQETPKGDGTIFEAVSKNKWISEEELLKIIFENKHKTHLSSLDSCYLLFLKNKKKLSI